MPLDASIYSNIKPVEMPNYADVATKAASLSQLGMQSKLLQQRAENEDRDAKISQALPVMDYLAGLPEDQRASEYNQQMKQLESKGIPMNNVPKDLNGNYMYDPTHFSGSYNTLKNSDVGLARQKAQAQLEKEVADSKYMSDARDPNSDLSKRTQSAIGGLGFSKEAEGLSYDQAQKIAPLLEKSQEAQMRSADRRYVRESAQDAKHGAGQDKTLQNVMGILESARGNPAVGQAEKDLYASDKAKSLANLYGDPNNLSSSQVNLLVSEIGKIASGGVPSMHELDGLTPGTLTGSLATAWGKLSNSPTKANAGEFVKQYQDYANALSSDAKKVIKDKYGRVIESRKSQLGDENYNALKAQYLDRFNEASGGDDQQSDQEAISWAKANFKDPRAKQILQEHGML
jgi:hypothetical protein